MRGWRTSAVSFAFGRDRWRMRLSGLCLGPPCIGVTCEAALVDRHRGPNGSPSVGDRPREIHGVSNRTDGKYVANLAVSTVASDQPMSSAWAPMKKSGSGMRGESLPDWLCLRLRYRR